MVVHHDQPYKRLRTMGIVDRIPAANFFEERIDALRQAVHGAPSISEHEIVHDEDDESPATT